jgi:hypothetical protein
MVIQGLHRAHLKFPQGGTCLEFGVYVGDSFMRQVELLMSTYTNTKIIGFDSWAGLPRETKGVWYPDRHSEGHFSTPKDNVLNRLGGLIHNPRINLVDGFFKDSLTPELQASIDDLIFVNVDVDIHSSCAEILEFIRPMLRPGVIIYFDDWKDPADTFAGEWGEHLAWREFTEKYPDIKWNTFVVNEWNQRCLEIE